MEKNYEILNWDSNFFGYKVAKLKRDSLVDENQLSVLEELYQKTIQLAYYSSKTPLPQNYFNNKYYNILLVLKRIPILKELREMNDFHEKISNYEEPYPHDDLIKLAQLAGGQGRFGNDPNIPEDKSNELFKNWIINSVNKKMATDVLVYKEENKIVGFSTLKMENEIGYAPLFAVDRKFEGKGVSFALMRAAESVLFKKGVTKVLSGTQELNKKALKVYKRYGFEIQKPEYVYHLWRK